MSYNSNVFSVSGWIVLFSATIQMFLYNFIHLPYVVLSPHFSYSLVIFLFYSIATQTISHLLISEYAQNKNEFPLNFLSIPLNIYLEMNKFRLNYHILYQFVCCLFFLALIIF